MKIGIITFYCSHNYGAMLQTYGLQEYLKSLGHEVFVIDFKPIYKIKTYKKSSYRYWLSRNPKMCFKRLVDYIKSKHRRNARWNNFNAFMNNRLDLYPYHKGKDFSEFDAIFIGSDQVWSAFHTGGEYDDIMFGVGFKCKVISYAPSCTSTSLNKQQKDYFRSHLDNLTAISVREEVFKNALQPLTNKTISVVLDPTFLAGVDVFNKISTPIEYKKPYIVLYEIIGYKQVHEIASHIAKQLDAEIIELTNGISNKHNDATVKDEASPEQFLGYIKNATCVVTTSFHGTAFSILFQKPFYTVLQGTSADNRMINLLSKLGLQERMVAMDEKPIFSVPDYFSSNHNLSLLETESKEFIYNSLKS